MPEPAPKPKWQRKGSITFREMLSLGPATWIACGLGLGLSPVLPGTVGGLWGIPLAWGLSLTSIWVQAGAIAVMCLGGIPICSIAARRIQVKDPSMVVWDEIASVPITFLFVPWSSNANLNAAWIALGFVLNRLFDITKPPPTRRFERLPGGLGIMSDDWIAGLYSCALLNAIMRGVQLLMG